MNVLKSLLQKKALLPCAWCVGVLVVAALPLSFVLSRGRGDTTVWKLLTHVWNGEPLEWVLAGALLCAAAALAVAFCVSRIPLVWKGKRAVFVGLTVALLFLSLGGSYAVLVPPFQAPDEPDHFLGFLARERPALVPAAKTLAQRGHLEEIAFHSTAKFLPEWAHSGSPVGFPPDVETVDMQARAPFVAWVWHHLASWFATSSVSQLLLQLRLTNVLLCAVGMGLAAAVVVMAGGGAAFACASLFVPAVPFFAMHVSNYPLLLALGAPCASIALAALFSQRRVMTGLVWGFLTACLMFCGHAGVVFTGMLIPFLLWGRVNDSSQKNRKSLCWNRFGFWAMSAVGVAAGAWLTGFSFAESLRLLPLPAVLEVVKRIGALASAPVLLATGTVLVGFGDVVLHLAVRALPQLSPRVMRGVCAFPTFVATTSLGFVCLGTKHHLPSIEVPSPMPLLAYILHVLAAFVGSLGTGNPDPFLVRSFFAGFGWLDTFPPGGVVWLLFLPFSLGFGATWLSAWRNGESDRLSRLLLWNAVWLIYLILLAVGAHAIPINLHGRYLMLFYFLFLPPCLDGTFSAVTKSVHCVAAKIGVSAQGFAFVRERFFVVAWSFLLLLQSAMLLFILRRYF